MSHYSMPYLPSIGSIAPARELSLAMTAARGLAAIIRTTTNKTHANDLGSSASSIRKLR